MTSRRRAVTRETLSLRVETGDRDRIDRAARLLGKSSADLVLEAARRAAQDALLDQTLYRASPSALAAFVAPFDAAPAPNARLRHTMTTRAPWD